MKQKKNLGFTLAEIIIAMSIAIITFSVVGVAVSTIKNNIEQTSADSTARQIFVAAQENITKLVVSGNDEKLYKGHPLDRALYPEECSQEDEIYYVKNTSEDATLMQLLLPLGTFDNGEQNNSYVIEYDPVSGSIIGVFYAGTSNDYDYYGTLKTNDYRKTSDNRKSYTEKKNYKLGYYGVDSEVGKGSNNNNKGNQNADVRTIVSVKNNDTLSVDIELKVNLDKYGSSDLTTFVTYEGLTSGKSKTNALIFHPASDYTNSEVLDSLTGTTFESKFSGFIPGEELKITVTTYVGDFTSKSESEAIQSGAAKSATIVKLCNSYFAKVSGEADQRTANIGYARHLRNLGKVSNSNKFTISSAVQTRNITIPKNYKNEQVVFTPITNNKLVTYDGANHTIEGLNITTTGYAGLFGTFGSNHKGEIKDLAIVDAFVSTDSYAGAVAGKTLDGVTLNNVGVYLSVDYGGTGVFPDDKINITGTRVGGLIGSSDGKLTINRCYAANVIYGTEHAGGLIGYAASEMKINYSYASSYIKGNGNVVGGLVGEASAYSIEGCYASGASFVTEGTKPTFTAAGLANGAATYVNRSYTLFDTVSATTQYSTVKSASSGNFVYFMSTLEKGTKATGISTYSITPDDLAQAEISLTDGKLKNGTFVLSNSLVTKPYNFNALQLESYPYPTISGMVHYGDWLINDANLKDTGFFYWEKHVAANGGVSYNYYMVHGADDNEVDTNIPEPGDESHDDGSRITDFGYGYTVLLSKYDPLSTVDWDTRSVKTKKLSGAKVNELDAKVISSSYMPEVYNGLNKLLNSQGLYKLVAYKTADSSLNDVSTSGDLYLTGAVNLELLGNDYTFIGTTHTTVGIKPKGSSTTYYYSFCPYFAQDICAGTSKYSNLATKLLRYNSVYNTADPRPHYIRSIDQLQYLNWNYKTKNCHTLSKYLNYTDFPFLNRMGYDPATTAISSVINCDLSEYRQTHDIDATSYSNYTPIAGLSQFMLDGSITDLTQAANLEMAGELIAQSNLNIFTWFGSEYDGHGYTIKNLNINSSSNTVGLFGATVGARLNNITMISDNGSTIKKTSSDNTLSDYFIGGIVGLACDATGDAVLQFVDTVTGEKADVGASIDNCAIGGYKIVDQSSQPRTILSGSAVGGLVGASTVRITNCSAVVDISIESTTTYGICAVGGLVGTASGGNIPPAALLLMKSIVSVFSTDAANAINKYSAVANCYTGGSISFSTAAKNNTSDKKGYYVGGIVGSNKNVHVTNIVNWNSVFNHNVMIANCYTYMDLPAKDSNDSIYCVANIFSTCATTLFEKIMGQDQNIANVLLDCYYYKKGQTSNYDNNFIEVESNIGSTGFERLKTQVVSITNNKTEQFGAGVQPMSYNEMVVKGSFSPAVYTFDCTNNKSTNPYVYSYAAKGDQYSYPFAPVVKRNGQYVHVGRWPSATKLTLSPGALSGSVNTINAYIAKGENVAELEGYLKTAIAKATGVQKKGYYAGTTLLVNPDGTFATNGTYCTGSGSDRIWTYAPSEINKINYLTATGKWAYQVVLHSPYLTTGNPTTITVDVESTDVKPSKISFSVDRSSDANYANASSISLTGWYSRGETSPRIDANGNVVSNLSFDANGAVHLYAGWNIRYSRYFQSIEPADKGGLGLENNEQYLFVYVKDGKYNFVTKGDAYGKGYKLTTKAFSTNAEVQVSSDANGNLAFSMPDPGETTWKYVVSDKNEYFRYGNDLYLSNQLSSLLGKVIISKNATRYNDIKYCENHSLRLHKSVDMFLKMDGLNYAYSDNEKFYLLKLYTNKDFQVYDYK